MKSAPQMSRRTRSSQSAPETNVVRLPTAATRKVKQPCNKSAHAIRNEMRKEWPGEFIFPSEREAMKTASMLMDVHATPELELLMGICAALDDGQRTTVLERLAPRVAMGHRSAQQALALFRTTKMTVGESVDLTNAMRRMNRLDGRA